MPYIKDKIIREEIDKLVLRFAYICAENTETIDITGKLNYFLFKLAKIYGMNYKTYRDFIGELEAAKLEIYRRLTAPYEDKKIKENGDVE